MLIAIALSTGNDPEAERKAGARDSDNRSRQRLEVRAVGDVGTTWLLHLCDRFTVTSARLPDPPAGLVYRTGYLGDVPFSEYERMSQSQRVFIESMLPGAWSWRGKRVLDFGCGVGRTLRQFSAEAEDAEFWGCDIHEPSVTWAREHLCPPFRVFRCEEKPGLPQADGYFDLIYAMSVYTHIVDHWAGWLLEHRRVLASDGLLLVSFLGEGMIEPIAGEPWGECRIGMNVLRPGVSFDRGGPNVFHSPWWLKAHWGRAFEIVALRAHSGDDEHPAGHGLVLMRPKPSACSVAELERLEEHESREITALQHQVRQSMTESRALQVELDKRHRSLATTARHKLATAIRAGAEARRFLRPR